MKLLTVFTPTFNRAHLLSRLYESLCAQTCKDFVWLVIDDGSTDGSGDLLRQWQAEGQIEVGYLFQENQGMSGAHNTAYKHITTEYNTCIDSDDAMPTDAVQLILDELKTIQNRKQISGIVGLDADFSGMILGTRFPSYLHLTTLTDIYNKYKLTGDKKLVYKTAVMREVEEYPLFQGEKLVPLSHKYLLADQKYFLKPVNHILCLVEYQADGSTNNMLQQYRRNPRGFAYARITRINLEKQWSHKFKNAVHLVSGSFFTADYRSWLRIKYTGTVMLAVPFGILLHLYVRANTNKGR